MHRISSPAIKGVHDHKAILGKLCHVPWLLNSCIPGVAPGYFSFIRWCGDEIEQKQRTYVEKDTFAAPTEAALDEDSQVVVVVGSETTATTLPSALYYLAKNPAIPSRLQLHLDEDMSKETLRLRPAVMMGGYRITPAEGIQVGEMYIPGNINVFVPVQLI
ncbi:Cytochrome P450 [Penicillium hordei]|uniref:Cytochrome P450 n=1 Tax=Penicillium hordei TaxID=40994 RepID=A0AAD6EDB2_9EURO|nr:Cytochrome P450 [Penicillium hordei]KAJ5615079.1 Cytochrome P450 [Penicillium hordei]